MNANNQEESNDMRESEQNESYVPTLKTRYKSLDTNVTSYFSTKDTSSI